MMQSSADVGRSAARPARRSPWRTGPHHPGRVRERGTSCSCCPSSGCSGRRSTPRSTRGWRASPSSTGTSSSGCCSAQESPRSSTCSPRPERAGRRPPTRHPTGRWEAARHECGRPQRLRLLLPAGHRDRLHRRSVAHKHQYVTPADFVRGRYGSPSLSLAVALTGILATMPYIALQLVGIQVVLEAMGIGGTGTSTLERDLPLFIAFAILAAYTYQSGLRAPALIAFVKDTMIYITVLVAVVYIPSKLGGWGHVFD